MTLAGKDNITHHRSKSTKPDTRDMCMAQAAQAHVSIQASTAAGSSHKLLIQGCHSLNTYLQHMLSVYILQLLSIQLRCRLPGSNAAQLRGLILGLALLQGERLGLVVRGACDAVAEGALLQVYCAGFGLGSRLGFGGACLGFGLGACLGFGLGGRLGFGLGGRLGLCCRGGGAGLGGGPLQSRLPPNWLTLFGHKRQTCGTSKLLYKNWSWVHMQKHLVSLYVNYSPLQQNRNTRHSPTGLKQPKGDGRLHLCRLTHRIALLSLFGRHRLSTLGPSFRRMRAGGHDTELQAGFAARGVGGQAFNCDLISDQLRGVWNQRLDALAGPFCSVSSTLITPSPSVSLPSSLAFAATLSITLVRRLCSMVSRRRMNRSREGCSWDKLMRTHRCRPNQTPSWSSSSHFTGFDEDQNRTPHLLPCHLSVWVFGWSPSRSKCSPASFTSQFGSGLLFHET